MEADEDFTDFVSAWASSLHRLAFLLTASSDAADDLLQASLEKAYANWPRIVRMQAPEAYVRKVMVNTLISSRRRSSHRREVLRAEVPASPVDPVEPALLDRMQLWPLVCALPQRQRAVIVLRYYEDLSEGEIAEVLGCARGTVKSQAADAMAALRRGLSALALAEGPVTTR